MLCLACQEVLSLPETSPPGSRMGEEPRLFSYPHLPEAWVGSHHIEPWQFLFATDERCYICSTIFRDLSPELRDQAQFLRTFYKLLKSGDGLSAPSSEDRYSLEFMIEILQGKAPIAEQQVFDCTGIFKILPKNENRLFEARLGLTDNTFSEKCKDQIRRWLEDCNCKTRHPKCNHGQPKAKFPTRLLNIGREGSKNFRLETLKNDTTAPQYVTLSHCWKAGMTTTLTMDSKQELERGAPLEALPKRFQNAVRIARWMGIEYMWIDALCIIQDSEEDWLAQSTKMGEIYANSYCNIAATSADPDKGCFTKRSVEMVEPYAIPSPISSDSTETHVVGYDDFWSNSLLDTTLHTRGWVLQERTLCRRTIHFGQEQMFWECRHMMACEAYPDGIPPEFSNWRTRCWRQFDVLLSPTVPVRTWWEQLKTMFSVAIPQTKTATNQAIYETWSKIVERFMEQKLTFDKDKLVAISGIAQKVAEATNERYLAGMWEGPTLAQSLLWYVLGRRQADGIAAVRKMYSDYRAPSWSWASLDAKVIWNWPSECDKVLVNIVETRIEEYAGSSFGRISSAEMDVQGYLFEAELEVMNKTDGGLPDEDGSYVLRLSSDSSEESSTNPEPAKRPTIECAVYLDTPLLPATSTTTQLLPVCAGWQGRSGRESASLAGLVLKKTEDSKSMIAYQRVGLFAMNERQALVLCGDTERTSKSVGTLLGGRRQNAITLV